MDAGLEALQRIREEVGVPVLTDVHDVSQVERVAEVVDVLQIPRFCAGKRIDTRRGEIREGR